MMLPFLAPLPTTGDVRLDPTAGADRGAAELRKAAQGFESLLVGQLIRAMRKTVPEGGLLGNAPGSDMYESWLDSVLAECIAERGTLGLGEAVARSLGATTRGRPPLAWPLDTRVASGFGPRRSPVTGEPGMHRALDLPARDGTPFRAAAAGRVTFAGPAGGYGLLVTLEHESGLETRYAHAASLNVRPGDLVVSGAVLGRVGSTGRSTGPHLHFEVRLAGEPVDPRSMLPAELEPSRTAPIPESNERGGGR